MNAVNPLLKSRGPSVARSHRSSLRIEGGLFGPDVLEALERADLPGQKPQDFGLPPHRSLTEEIATTYHHASALWHVFRERRARLAPESLGTTETRDLWVIPLLRLLSYEVRYNPRAYDVDGVAFPISHWLVDDEELGQDGEPSRKRPSSPPPRSLTAPTPIHIVGFRQPLGSLTPTGRLRFSPHALVQQYLNRSEALWGLVTNGIVLRVLRDSTFIRRQSYVEFDLEAIFEEERFDDFTLLYRLLHRTRLPQTDRPADCLLEQYYQQSIEQGGRVREQLRKGVEACLEYLANGFLQHPQSAGLRASLAASSALTLYRQLLRLVYRFLFLLVAEERGLMGGSPIYQQGYSISRLRRLTEIPTAYNDETDLWHGLRALWQVLTDEHLAALLDVPPLNGELFAYQALDDAVIVNRDLLTAFWHLAFYDDPPRRVNYAALDTEELGSVYESLLELHPQIEWRGNRPRFHMEASGSERRSTGSHYTPPELVTPLLQHTLEPVLHERLAACRTDAEKVAAILSMKVLDPACGSGHFLLAVARRLGKELARLRTGEDEPAPEALQQGVRDAITHCIYGVDKNPLAVELCRVALWLEGHAQDKPLTFLEHRIRHGDSLVGVRDLSVLEDGIPDAAYKPHSNADRAILTAARKRNARERKEVLFQHSYVTQALAEFAETMRRIADMPEATIAQVRAKREAYRQAQASPEFQRLRLACDAYTAAFFQTLTPTPNLSPTVEEGQGKGRTGDGVRAITTAAIYDALSYGTLADPQLAAGVETTRAERAFFHWPLEFAEVFARGGFDVVIGNPPFMGGLRVSGNFGEPYRTWLEYAFAPFGGTADLCAAFFRHGFRMLRPGGRLGMIATNTLGQGDTRESGLAVILEQGGVITSPNASSNGPVRPTSKSTSSPYVAPVLPLGEGLRVRALLCSTLKTSLLSPPASTTSPNATPPASSATKARRSSVTTCAASALCWSRLKPSACWHKTRATPSVSSPT